MPVGRVRKFILIVPLLVVVIFILCITLLFGGIWEWAIILFLFDLWLNWNTETFAFHRKKASTFQKGNIRILSYNINRAFNFSVNCGSTHDLIAFIEKQKADIVLLQEYSETVYPEVQKELAQHYPYNLGSELGKRFKSVFSKYPIKEFEQLKVRTNDTFNNLMDSDLNIDVHETNREVLPICSVKVRVADYTLRIYNCHLMSNNLSVAIREKNSKKKSIFKLITSIINRIDYGYAVREQQVDSICHSLSDTAKEAILVCGDFNDIRGSATLKALKRNGLKDAWWDGGCGFGFTYHGLGMKWSLDHIFYSDRTLTLKKIYIPHSNSSDHYPIVADFDFVDSRNPNE